MPHFVYLIPCPYHQPLGTPATLLGGGGAWVERGKPFSEAAAPALPCFRWLAWEEDAPSTLDRLLLPE